MRGWRWSTVDLLSKTATLKENHPQRIPSAGGFFVEFSQNRAGGIIVGVGVWGCGGVGVWGCGSVGVRECGSAVGKFGAEVPNETRRAMPATASGT